MKALLTRARAALHRHKWGPVHGGKVHYRVCAECREVQVRKIAGRWRYVVTENKLTNKRSRWKWLGNFGPAGFRYDSFIPIGTTHPSWSEVAKRTQFVLRWAKDNLK